MQLPDVPISRDWAEKILTILGSILGGGFILKVVQLILNKAKRKSELALSDAQAENARLDVFAKYRAQLDQLQDRLNHVEATSDQREADCREQIRFLQESITYQRKRLDVYVNRGHAISNEANKLVLYITNLRESLAAAIERMKQVQSLNGLPEGAVRELTELVILITPGEVTFRSRQEIDEKFPLPKVPDGMESIVDSGERERPPSLK